MTIEEAKEAVEAARRKAYEAARKLFPPGMTGLSSSIVDPARLSVLETLVIGFAAKNSPYPGTDEMKVLVEMRDYWELVAEEIRS